MRPVGSELAPDRLLPESEMAPVARFYISSTFDDLKEVRAEVRLTIERMGQDNVAMEYYTAEDARPLEKCLHDVESCDVYVLLLAFRYGYVPEGYDKSITHLEYLHAVDVGKPCLVFLLDDGAAWPMNRVDASAKNVREFRDEVRRDRLTASFTSDKDIGARVSEAIYNLGIRDGTATGRTRTDWDAYRSAVFDRHRWVRLAVIAGAKWDRGISLIPLTDVFVAQPTMQGRPTFDVPDERPGGDAAEPEERVEDIGLLQESSLQVLGREPKQVILGGPGTGKSSLFQFAMLTLCDPAPVESAIPLALRHGPLPFLVELRQYSLGKAASFVDYIVTKGRDAYGVEIEADELRAVLDQAGRSIVLFDGLDEILSAEERARAIEQLSAFARRYGEATIVVSSRIAGYDPEPLQLGGFSHSTLLPFGMPEIRDFVPRWYRYYTSQGDERDAAGLVGRIAESPRLLDLAGNPLLLTMMAVIYKHQDLPEKRWQLYERCTEVLLEQWDVKRKNIERDETIGLGLAISGRQKAEILANVSMHMLREQRAGGELNAIERDPLVGIVAAYLVDTYRKSPGEARSIATEILDHLRERTYILAEIGEDVFGFVHRTFMEYFAASQAFAEFNRRKADYAWLTEEVFGTHWERDEWREILLLLTAMIRDQHLPIEEIVDSILARRSEGLPRSLELGARCLAEAGADDSPWSRDIVGRLVKSILWWAGKTTPPGVEQFMDQALAAFTMLATTVQVSDGLQKQIAEAAARSPRHRMVAWQMELAFRARQDRLRFAIDALRDSEEAVRLGAIATLEREWPGWTDTGTGLVELLRTDRVTRVRQAAVQALRRSWPEQPGILGAIAARIDDESTYRHVIWLIEYVATDWRRDPRALEVVIDLIRTKRRAGPRYSYAEVVNTGSRAIADGWGNVAGVLDRLRVRSVEEADPYARQALLFAIARRWSDAADGLAWLADRARALDPEAKRQAMATVAETSAGRPEALGWLQGFATEDADVETRRAALILIAGRWGGDPRVLTWFEGRAVEDSDAGVRSTAIDARSSAWRDDARRAAWLQQRAVDDPDAAVRGTALRAASTTGREGPVDAVGQPLVHLDAQRSTFLQTRAIDDPHPHARSVALSLVAADRGPDAVGFVRHRAVSDPDPVVRGHAVELVGRTLWIPYRPRHAAFDFDAPLADLVESGLPGPVSVWLGDGDTGDRETLQFLEDVAMGDSAPTVRRAALLVTGVGQSASVGGLGILRSCLASDPDREVTATALLLLISRVVERYDSEFLAAVSRRIGGEVEGTGASVPWPTDAFWPLISDAEGDEVRSILRDTAATGRHPEIRAAAGLAAAALQPSDDDVGWLTELADREPDPKVGALFRQAVAERGSIRRARYAIPDPGGVDAPTEGPT